jgi:hypothetical protein
MADRHDHVALAVQYQERCGDPADAGERVEAIMHQHRGGDKRVVVLGGGGDAGKRRFEDDAGDLALGGQIDRDARPQ